MKNHKENSSIPSNKQDINNEHEEHHEMHEHKHEEKENKSKYFGNYEKNDKCHCGCSNCDGKKPCACGCKDCNCNGMPKGHCCD